MEKLNFVAIDFETMTPQHTSACAIGMVKVVDNIIFQKFYSLIKPIPDDSDRRNTMIHGLTDEDVANAPTFAELFPTLLQWLDTGPIVCHNAGTDIDVLRCCMAHYKLSGINCENYVDTYRLYGKALDVCCADCGIPFINHHDALADAEACAKLYLCHHGTIVKDDVCHDYRKDITDNEARHYEHDTLQPLKDGEVPYPNHPEYLHQKMVITGTFDQFPKRNAIGAFFKLFGADIDTGISERTNIVIVGHKAGPKKLEKIEDMMNRGKKVKVIYEAELCQIIHDLKEEIHYGEDGCSCPVIV